MSRKRILGIVVLMMIAGSIGAAIYDFGKPVVTDLVQRGRVAVFGQPYSFWDSLPADMKYRFTPEGARREREAQLQFEMEQKIDSAIQAERERCRLFFGVRPLDC